MFRPRTNYGCHSIDEILALVLLETIKYKNIVT